MTGLRLVLVIGRHAQRWHLGALAQSTLTETMTHWREIMTATSETGGPMIIPLPHPSWRNNAWLARNRWFEAELLPVLRDEVARRVARK